MKTEYVVKYKYSDTNLSKNFLSVKALEKFIKQLVKLEVDFKVVIRHVNKNHANV